MVLLIETVKKIKTKMIVIYILYRLHKTNFEQEILNI